MSGGGGGGGVVLPRKKRRRPLGGGREGGGGFNSWARLTSSTALPFSPTMLKKLAYQRCAVPSLGFSAIDLLNSRSAVKTSCRHPHTGKASAPGASGTLGSSSMASPAPASAPGTPSPPAS